MDRYKKELNAFDYLKNNQNKTVTIKELSDHCGWSEATIKKYLTQNWFHYVEIIDAKSFQPNRFNELSYQDFRDLQSQSGKLSEQTPHHIEDKNAPFSREKISLLLQRDEKNQFRLKKSEHFDVEYKESYSFSSSVAKSIAAFANHKGGYFLFGVKDTREIIGCKKEKFQPIEKVEIFSATLSKYFSHLIHWESDIYDDPISGYSIGLLYIKEAPSKPIISIYSGGEAEAPTLGQIYFRYAGHSDKIRYDDLRNIIQTEIKKEVSSILNKIQKITQYGDSAEILNTKTGELSDIEGTYYLPEELIEKITFIKEGQFSEKEGAPTLKLIGDAHAISNKKSIHVIKKEMLLQHIDLKEIFRSFFEEEALQNPEEYLKAACGQNTSYLPFYFIVKQTGFNKEALLTFTEQNKAKSSFCSRINSEDILSQPKTYPIEGTSEIPKLRKKYLESLQTKNYSLSQLSKEKNPEYFFQCIPYLKEQDMDWNYLKPLLKTGFNKYYDTPQGKRFDLNIRKAVCHIDKLLYREF